MVRIAPILGLLGTIASFAVASPAPALEKKTPGKAAETSCSTSSSISNPGLQTAAAKSAKKSGSKPNITSNTGSQEVSSPGVQTTSSPGLQTMSNPSSRPTPTSSISLGSGGSCIFTNFDSISSKAKSCSTIVLNGVAVPAGQTLDLTNIGSGTRIVFEGTTTFGYEEWSGPLLAISGSNIIVTGAAGSVIDGGGSRWWDGKGGNGGKAKPKFFSAYSLTNSTISGLTFKDSPVQLVSIDGCSGLTISGLTMDNSAGVSSGHNTDAFDVGSSDGVTISEANIVNQDDCLAINSGTGITFTGGSCSGGHGLSIGSVGGRTDNTVSNVTISSSSVSDSDNGVRIKTVYGATGKVSGVTYKDITLSNIKKYGIVIEQDYENGSPTGKPTDGVPITDLTISNVHGTVSASGSDIYILCGSGSCSSWTWSGVSITGGSKSSKCMNVPAGASC